ncbi:hypothetical protein FHS83_003161 [Rhizomicrobium palustre]|uniref:Uncharacterized protein n=1 Tax=Rhizomicrobium palustre TaxID=189966 RepID=A0A846N2K8_9PROT|nr:hypothetical protein [Rhizomicrobium palustre]NIK89843.1 hypothetical protein [Rhizomicrobium palustre]
MKNLQNVALLPPRPVGWLWPILGQVSAVLNSQALFLRQMALVVLVGQVVFWIAAAASRVMLFADGSFFAYALATGHAWELKWQFLTTRISTYLLTVVPTEAVCAALSCNGSQIAVVNGAIFYLVPLLQFAYLVHIAWRRFPALLAFPLVQYAFAVGLGYGFPSEILLAPGFFWICMFSILQRPLPLGVLLFSFAGLVFSHEMALAAALVVVLQFFIEMRGKGSPGAISLFQARLFGAVAVALFVLDGFLILSGGGSGGNANALHVFDPRRLLIDPALWLVAAATLAAAAFSLFAKRAAPLVLIVGFTALCAVLTILAGDKLNYALGRYDSARSIIGFSMAGLGILFIGLRLKGEAGAALPGPVTFLRLALPGVLAVIFAANAVFLVQWTKGLAAFEKGVNAQNPSSIIRFSAGWDVMDPVGFRYSDRAGFSWAWPYRSIVLAENYRPKTIFYLPDSISPACGSPRLARFSDSPVPASVTRDLEGFACGQAGRK